MDVPVSNSLDIPEEQIAKKERCPGRVRETMEKFIIAALMKVHSNG